MQLRPYQKDAATAALAHIKKSLSPCVIEAPTGAGKSWIIAAIAKAIRDMSGKKVLILAPSGELVTQDHEKYLATGEPASIYSASTGNKDLRHPVVFGSPLSVKNNLRRFSGYAAVIIDEAHGITPTIRGIIEHLRNDNDKLRVVGLSATPHRMNTGYIYACDYEMGYLDEDQSIDPYFDLLVYRISAQMLIDDGYLTKPVFEATRESYDTTGLKLNRTGNWDAKTVDRAFVGQGRKTSHIVADVVAKSQNRQGVMLFAATIKHAQEVCESLPPEITRLVTGETPAAERERILADFKARRVKYLVNVAVLTTGFDASHVDHVAILRATESAGLLMQIIGRGLRIDDNKPSCLISDYAQNIERHFPHGDVFAPEIKARRNGTSEPIEVTCPLCAHENNFSRRPNPDEYDITADGYFADMTGAKIEFEGQFLPAHFGRRCAGFVLAGGQLARCGYKWSFKECPECGHENDIAARFCTACRGEIVDPNEKLRIEAAKIAADPYAVKFADVDQITIQQWPGRDGKPDTLRVDYHIDNDSISHWYAPDGSSQWIRSKWEQFSIGVWGEILDGVDDAVSKRDRARTPFKIAYRKKRGSKYNEIVGVEYAIS